MKTDNKNNNHTDLDSLIPRLKKEDNNYAAIVKAIQIIYLIFIPLFVVITIRKYIDSHSFIDIISGACKISAFLILALSFRKYYKEYKFVDYSLPTIQMLKKAAYRYQLFQKESIRVIIPLILIDIALTLDLMEDSSIIQTQVIFWGLIMFGVLIGLLLWYTKYKPLRDQALQLIKEIEGE